MAGADPSRPIADERELAEYFRAAAKDRDGFRVGIEQEKIGVRDDGSVVPYDGLDGIAAILGKLGQRGYAAYREDGQIIALDRDGERVTVEPGGQLELSGATLPTAVACRDGLRRHLRELRELAGPLGVRFIAGGFRPFGSIDDVPWLPKRRYAVMRAYLPGKGRLGHEMMKRTATVQANLDFQDERDAVERMRAACGVTSVVTAMYAASPISDGRPNGYRSWRAAVWLETDEDRCGLLPFVFRPEFGFRHYVEWAADVPLFFVLRAGAYRPAPGYTFRRFMREGWQGERATVADWELHLSTLFPEVRLKKYIELRGADAAPLPFAEALAAFWRGLLDDPAAREAAWRLVSGASFDDRVRLRREVPRAGLLAVLGGRPLREIAVDLCRLAADGLSRLPGGAEDAALLDPLRMAAATGRSPSDDLLDDFHATGGDPRKLVDRWEFRV